MPQEDSQSPDHHVAASTCSVPPQLSHCLFSIHRQYPAGLVR